ncbi:MAG: hypothetical protein DMD67_19065 [Gemmatimonadetes bacterium]|nr:MAG: hypothetical protein DMD67_19065 [Gemmatimonadota bacterium]
MGAVGQDVGHDHVIHVRAVVHRVDHHIPLRDALERCLVLIIDGDAVEQVEYDLREIVADPIVREDVELRYDLVDILVHTAADRGL